MDSRNMIICYNLKKVYCGKNGNTDKLVVRGLSLALRKGQCFGMLGPNGAGKTSFINMMIGLVAPTYGTAYIHGMDLRKDMNEIYANIGVCPQHDFGDKSINKYNSAMKRRLSVAITLIGNPKVVPFQGREFEDELPPSWDPVDNPEDSYTQSITRTNPDISLGGRTTLPRQIQDHKAAKGIEEVEVP